MEWIIASLRFLIQIIAAYVSIFHKSSQDNSKDRLIEQQQRYKIFLQNRIQDVYKANEIDKRQDDMDKRSILDRL